MVDLMSLLRDVLVCSLQVVDAELILGKICFRIGRTFMEKNWGVLCCGTLYFYCKSYGNDAI